MHFDQAYAQLNPAQREAVGLSEGCVMVVAGPGTGKTQVMGVRIAHLLQSGLVQAEEILCLTFTEAATVALRNRLYDLIGSEAQRVNIHTYHSFCNSVIQENKHLFGILELDAASDLDVLEVITELIDALPNDHILKRLYGDAYFDLNNLKRLFGLMKKDHLNGSDVERLVKDHLDSERDQEYYRYKRKTKNAQVGDLKPEWYRLEEQMERLVAAAQLLQDYDRGLAKRKRYDFNDMINWIIDLLETDERLRMYYQDRFQHILVDEYQDTNGSQNALLYLLLDNSDNPNVFVVGDDDQSIYKFQGANVMNIRDFHDRYAECIRTVVLVENYRSSPAILSGSNGVIGHNQERIINLLPNVSKNIRASHPVIRTIEQPIQILAYPNTYQEIIGISQAIRRAEENGTPLKEIAVLYRNHDQSVDLMNHLQAEGIPFNVSMAQDILLVPIVRQLLQLLEYLKLENEALDKGRHLLFELFHMRQFLHLSPLEIGTLAHHLRERSPQNWRSRLRQVVADPGDPILSKAAKEELLGFLDDVEHWLKEMHNTSLQVLVEQVMSQGGFIARALAGTDSIFEIQCLRTLFQFVKDETAKDPLLNLPAFLHTVDLLRSNGVKLSVQKVVHGANGVNLMTVHGSKGLEFDHVHMLGCTADKWERSGQSLPFNLNKIIPGEPERAYEEEGRRLFYVGMTRARKQLSVSYSLVNDKDKQLNRSVYVNELMESEGPEFSSVNVDEHAITRFFANTIERSSDTFRQLSRLDFVDRQLEQFRMSATNLNNYLRCPVAFFYENIIRVPSAKNDMATYGTAVHDTLELYFRQMLEHPDHSFQPISVLPELFEQRLFRHRESFTEESYERYLALGRREIPLYAQDRMHLWEANRNVQVEAEFKNNEMEGIPIRGKIDKIIVQDNDLIVVDYKTGRVKNARPKLKPPLPSERLDPDETDHQRLYGGDYWRQMVFYKILIDSDKRYSKTVAAGLFDFVEREKDTYSQESVPIGPHDIELVKSQIRDAYRRIMNKEFENGCKRADCAWCNFNEHYLNQQLFFKSDLLRDQREEMEER